MSTGQGSTLRTNQLELSPKFLIKCRLDTNNFPKGTERKAKFTKLA